MKTKIGISLVLASLLATFGTLAYADGPLTREQVKMDRDTFLATMRWDENTGQWVLKSNMAPPKGVLSRSDVLAMRDDWLRMHTFDENTGTWVTMASARDMSKLSREDVQMETVRFLMMYRFDESKSEWVSKLMPVH